MSVETYIRAIPKVELNLQFEAAIPRETLLMLADQNNMPDEIKRFDKWVKQYKNPEFKKLDELTAMLRSWLRYGDDLTRTIYDIGVALSKDNVRYAEIVINPLSFVTGDLTFEEFIEAINDGRDRAERAWGIQMRWVMGIPRAEPRFADEIARWATSATARNGGVVAIALVGDIPTRASDLSAFERAFSTALKKDLPRIAYLGGKDDFDEAIALLHINTIVDAWGIADSPETLASLADRNVTLSLGIWRAIARNWVRKVETYPLPTLQQHNAPIIFSSDIPVLTGQTLSDEYLALQQHNLMTLDEIDALAHHTLNKSHLEDDEKTMLDIMFQTEYDILRAEHLTETQENPDT